MAVFGVGAFYGGVEDMLCSFVQQSVVCVGWDSKEAPTAHKQMQSVKAGDLIFIKSFNAKHGLYIKAVGVCVDSEFRKITTELGFGVGVKWMWVGEPAHRIGKLNDKFDFMRGGTIYEEFNEGVVRTLVSLMCSDRAG